MARYRRPVPHLCRSQRYFDFVDPAFLRLTLLPLLRSAADPDSLLETALRLEDAGQLSQAAEVYRQAIDLDPREPVLHFNLGNVLYALGQLPQSLASFRKAVRLDPAYAEAWNNLGNVHADLDQPELALAAFRRALELRPGYDLARSNREALLSGSVR
jgi:tetratricopeptide (TPR) repeat protein